MMTSTIEIEYRCDPCDRTMKRPIGELASLVVRHRARCQICDADLALPDEVLEAAEARARSRVGSTWGVCGRPRPGRLG